MTSLCKTCDPRGQASFGVELLCKQELNNHQHLFLKNYHESSMYTYRIVEFLCKETIVILVKQLLISEKTKQKKIYIQSDRMLYLMGLDKEKFSA